MANVASSSNLALLVSDFQALASETKRKHADVKEVSDRRAVNSAVAVH